MPSLHFVSLSTGILQSVRQWPHKCGPRHSTWKSPGYPFASCLFSSSHPSSVERILKSMLLIIIRHIGCKNIAQCPFWAIGAKSCSRRFPFEFTWLRSLRIPCSRLRTLWVKSSLCFWSIRASSWFRLLQQWENKISSRWGHASLVHRLCQRWQFCKHGWLRARGPPGFQPSHFKFQWRCSSLFWFGPQSWRTMDPWSHIPTTNS